MEINTLFFRVRKGLALHVNRVTESKNGSAITRTATVVSYGDAFGKTLVELTRDEIPRHAHALEPTDEESGKALAELHVRPWTDTTPVPSSPAALMSEVTRNVIAELLAAGVIEAPGAKSGRPPEPSGK